MLPPIAFPYCQEKQDKSSENLRRKIEMNAKRQTIWLVSMLSLMVVLSAYYLFTEDVNKLDLASTDTTKNPQAVKIDMNQIDKSAAGTDLGKSSDKTAGKIADKSTAGTDTKNDAKIVTKTDTKTTASSDASKDTQSANTDDQVLQKMAEAKTTSASDYFTTEQMKNHEDLKMKTEQLLATVTDPKQKPEAVVKANNELEQISGNQEKIDNLEDILLKDFPQAVVSQDGNKWKVTVQSQKLEKSQGVTIVDLVMKELGTAPENIKIQYIQP
jgi:stage III sporulation protein AH